MEVDYMIVGQGIAGTVLADTLIQSGKSVYVIDNPSLTNASKVAGGLYNPITGRKMVKTWHADAIFPYLDSYYSSLQNRLGSLFYIPKPIYRPFVNTEEVNEWMAKSADPSYAPFIRKVYDTPLYPSFVKDELGGLLLNHSGYVTIDTLLAYYRAYLKARGILWEGSFDFDQMDISNERIVYRGIKAKKLVFCDGKLATKNPFFDWLPMQLVKGELLLIRVKEVFDVIFNRGVFVIPQDNGICKVGATYDHQDLSNEVTAKGKSQLLEKLDGLVKMPFEVVNQIAGVRPATKDRRPFIGVHPVYHNIGIFNGFGTKGVSLVPYFAGQFAKYLTQGLEVDSEVNIQRFFSLYWKS